MELYNNTFNGVEGTSKSKAKDQSSDLMLNDTNRSRDMLISRRDHDKKHNINDGNSQINKEVLNELNILNKYDDSLDDDKMEYLISDEIKEATPYDFGYLTLFHTGNENLDNEIKNAYRNEDKREIQESQYYTSGNFLGHFNEGKESKKSIVKCPLELLLHMAKSQEKVVRKLNIENPYAHREKRKNKLKEFGTKKLTKEQSMKEEEDELIKNTINSHVHILQNEEIREGKTNVAIKINLDYTIRKAKYECELIKLQLDKYNDYLNNTKKLVSITDPKPFADLEKNSRGLMKLFEEIISDELGMNSIIRNRLEQLSNEARSFLVDYMAGIVRFYEKYLMEKRAANEQVKTYIKWKSKLSQLIGIWDLANSNGTEIRTSYKYLILKRFMTLRALARQEDKEFIAMPLEKKSVVQVSFFLSLFCDTSRNVNLHPISLFLDNNYSRYIMDFTLAIFLLYSFITIPIRLLLGSESKDLKVYEKFVDMYFYIDIMIGFRTSFKDKFNENIFDIRQIIIKYLTGYFLLDFISTIPWYFFLISNNSLSEIIKLITHLMKIARVLKLLPILNKLEQLKGAGYFRVMKLLLIYSLFIHFIACFIARLIDNTLDYNSMNKSCYNSNTEINKSEMSYFCQYIITSYQAAYIIPGQYTSYLQVYNKLSTTLEYVMMIIFYLLGQFISAYTFGSITSIIQNLDQGTNFLTAKTDLIREHMIFYDIGVEIQNDVTVYYNYLWQRHKDVIYGKHHFDLLSKSLREKFEDLNLNGNEIFMHTFNKLNNTKLIGFVLRELKKKIVFPYEILYDEGSLVPGLYILTHGDIVFTTVNIENAGHSSKSVDYTVIVKEMEKRVNWIDKKYDELAKDMCVIFPLVSAFIKTGRTYQRCYATDFADLLFLPLHSYDEMIVSFPVEMHSLKHEIMNEVDRTKLFDNLEIFKVLAMHSARSIGKNYEKEYNKLSIWIPIPIPISQRKIATNYIESFVKKIRNQWREIIVNSDMNICLNSILINGFLRSDNKNKEKKDENNDKNVLIQQSDQLDVMKNLTKALSSLAEEFFSLCKKPNNELNDSDSEIDEEL